MSNQTIGLDDRLYNYLLSATLRERDVLKALREETAQHPQARMQISPEQGQFMALLIQLMGAKKTLEIGVFTGYSTLAVALALPEDGQIIACDVNEKDTAIAKPYWEKANVAHKIDLRIAPGLDTLDSLIAAGESETFDFSFVDADKRNYDNYYEKSLNLLGTLNITVGLILYFSSSSLMLDLASIFLIAATVAYLSFFYWRLLHQKVGEYGLLIHMQPGYRRVITSHSLRAIQNLFQSLLQCLERPEETDNFVSVNMYTGDIYSQ